MTGFTKPSRTARRLKTRTTRLDRKRHELNEKMVARKRDGYCRFPLCGCRRLKLPLHVSHQEHKGMGGNPEGDRSTSEKLILLCEHRHQFGHYAIHKGTLRVEALTGDGTAGPCAFSVLADSGEWFEVGREIALHVFEPPTSEQRSALDALSTMLR